MNGSELLAEILKKENIKYLSCFPSTALIESCAEINIKPIICRQERIGVAIADGISRSTRQAPFRELFFSTCSHPKMNPL